MSDNLINNQNRIFENVYSTENISRHDYHITTDRLTRFLRDRRLEVAYSFLCNKFGQAKVRDFSFLVVCGGVGGEAYFFSRKGCKNVTNSDFSENSLIISNQLFNEVNTSLQNAENLSFEDKQFDIVVVQDGLHHLPRPALGFTEMLRVAKYGVVVIEPYSSLVGDTIGAEWEHHEDVVNYVFRWNRTFFSQLTKSYLLKNYSQIKVFRIWDHNVVIRRLVSVFPSGIRTSLSRFVYSILSVFNVCGNMFIGVVIK